VFDWFAPAFAATGDRFAGYLDDGDAPMAAFGRDLPQLGDTHGFTPAPAQRLVMCVGSPAGKRAVVGRLSTRGGVFAGLTHPSAWVTGSARFGQGLIVGPFTNISSDCVIGDHVTVNGHCSIGHDAVVGDFVTLSCHVDLTGGVKVGAGGFFGSGARVLPRVKIGEGCTIGAGAVVVRGAPDGATLYAAPARRL
jgi:sugar O-acyltransferase (sialic acid O-acetyltransferase NeuD family)